MNKVRLSIDTADDNLAGDSTLPESNFDEIFRECESMEQSTRVRTLHTVDLSVAFSQKFSQRIDRYMLKFT